ncbi:hypothetical protein GCM10010921_01470 [Microbacterium album]|uniref:Uncharacterized protein n=1 Tax=Microbacterium album TaxID=2053191 RepID=A0A917MKS3_9MICO|nr:hypothetical protein GCM10010921_01470 [Microbacterium album]
MSAGPIKQSRDAWKPQPKSTPDAHRVCAPMPRRAGLSYCGRNGRRVVSDWAQVKCADCLAARAADVAAGAE